MLVLAAVLRLWALARPDQLVFDEIYYVRDAVSQLAHGFPTTWPNDDAAFTDPRAFSDRASAIAHPSLGKWLIGLGILAFGPDNGWGWRISSAVAGIAAVGVTMRLGYLMGRSMRIACLAGLLLAIDGVHVVLSRVGLLDGFLTLLVVLGALFVWHDQARLGCPAGGSPSRRIHWRRPWLLAAGAAFGAAAAVKWSGLYPLAAFLLLITARDVILRLRHRGTRSRISALLASLRQALVAGVIALPAAALAYLATWIGWVLHPNAQDREPGEPWWVSLWEWHTRSLAWHASLTAEHPYQSSPLGWPLALRPTAMYRESIPQGAACPWAGGCVSAVTPLPNPLVTWAGVLALLFLCWIAVRALWRAVRLRSSAPLVQPGLWAAVFVLVGYLSGWLPWVLTFSRSAVFQFYAVVLTPFAALALALLLGAVAAVPAL
ncbi:MAG: phospholipid carrier-dependent glycosyltransferase, partial [Actinobacteria bacterium]|nr:phospholipid carrier-dependent glycosyltransferase [Actinomycetota bacterium]